MTDVSPASAAIATVGPRPTKAACPNDTTRQAQHQVEAAGGDGQHQHTREHAGVELQPRGRQQRLASTASASSAQPQRPGRRGAAKSASRSSARREEAPAGLKNSTAAAIST